MVHFTLLLASTPEGGIGYKGKLPWHLPRDMEFFRRTTTHGALIMGRKTWDSLPRRPLPGRLNIVVTSSATEFGALAQQNLVFTRTLDDALAAAARHGRWPIVIGGAALFAKALSPARMAAGECTAVYHTAVKASYPHDVAFRYDFAAAFASQEVLDEDEECRWTKYYGAQHEEWAYLALVHDILTRGVPRSVPSGAPPMETLAVFARSLRFSLQAGTVPLLVTKRVFWKGVVEELLWFIRGRTDARELAARGVHIWDANASRAALDARGFHDRAEGDLGPIYGFQWRHYGAAYRGSGACYDGEGVDQLAALVRGIRAAPHARTHLITAWNPAALPDMALPPCHVFAQFFVESGTLYCQVCMRSADVGLGLPFNMASYALLTHLVAHVCGLAARELVLVLGDAHVYTAHIPGLRAQLERVPRTPFPKVTLTASARLEDFTPEHIALVGYDPAPAISLPLIV